MDTGKKRILCADADEDHRSLESALLRAAGYEVVTAEGISDALRIARGGDFDLYLVAYKLQDGTGLELCKRLREFDGVTPVLFFSARVYEMDVRGALEAGADAFLRKPDDTAMLAATASGLIGSRRDSATTRGLVNGDAVQ